MSITVSVIPARELDAYHASRWSAFQEADPALASPFFRPEFTAAVAAVRSDSYVAILETGGKVGGYFPFQRRWPGIGGPIGGDRSNYHGVIADPGLYWDAEALLRGCDLRVWKYHHLVTSQRQFEHFHAKQDESPFLDLSDGFSAYAEVRERSGSQVIRRLRQQARRIERAVGPLRFEHHTGDVELLHLMMRWKSRQYRATGNVDRFAISWNVGLLEQIHAAQGPQFAGMLPVLYAGNDVVAIAMCLRSRHVLHYWFPAYRADLTSFSPGMLLLLALAERAEMLGIRTLDLGKGHAPYKERLATGGVALAEGEASVPSLVSHLSTARRAIKARVRTSPLGGPARAALQIVRQREAMARHAQPQSPRDESDG